MPEIQQPKIIREPLQWLFTAYFDDEDILTQDQADTSIKADTTQETYPSRFTDVLDKQASSKLVRFELNHIVRRESVAVDMVTGAFIVNGVPINIHHQYFEPRLYPLKLIYFREKREQQDVKFTKMADGTIKEEPSGHVRSFVNRYFIGWEAQLDKPLRVGGTLIKPKGGYEVTMAVG